LATTEETNNAAGVLFFQPKCDINHDQFTEKPKLRD